MEAVSNRPETGRPETGRPEPGLWGLFATWSSISAQSWGGGSSTFMLIHEACRRHGWMDDAEFVRTWALVQVSPGINLVKLTMLIGYRLRGWPGLLASITGLLLPAALVTVLITAGFAAVRDQPALQSVMGGLIPATIGLSIAMAVNMAQPLLRQASGEGRRRLAAHIAVMAAAALLYATAGASPALVLLLAATTTVLVLSGMPVRNRPNRAG